MGINNDEQLNAPLLAAEQADDHTAVDVQVFSPAMAIGPLSSTLPAGEPELFEWPLDGLP